MSTQLIRGMIGEAITVAGRECVSIPSDNSGIILYGPYEERPAGCWTVEFSLALADDVPAVEDPICVRIEVLVNDGRNLITERRLLFSELTRDLSTFSLTFRLQEACRLEYRVQGNGQVALLVAGDVGVRKAEAVNAPTAPRGSPQRALEYEREFLDGYLRNVSGVIHVGANYGQERRYYWLIGVDVLWVEPIREIYEDLLDNIAPYPRQRAINALLADKEGAEVEFRIASNGGASSSILPLEDHAELFPDVQYVETRKLTSTTLSALVRDGKVDLSLYQALTIDTEGAEMLVLQGAAEVLSHFQYVRCEASDFQSRTGNPTAAQLDGILRAAGFTQIGRPDFGTGPGNVGTNWDIVWKRMSADAPQIDPGLPLPVVFDPMEVHGIEKDG